VTRSSAPLLVCILAMLCASAAPLPLGTGSLPIPFGSSPALAGGFHNADVGTRRMGMFANIAKPDDPTAIFHNPAGLVLVPGTQLYTSLSMFFLDIGLRLYDSQGNLLPADHEIRPDWNIGALPFIGASSDLGTERLRLGFAVYAPNAYGAALPDDEPTRYHATQVLFLGSRATASVAYEVTRKFSVAASASLVHLYLTANRMMNPLVLQDPDHRFDEPQTSAQFDSELALDGQGFSWAVDVGVLFRPLETLSIGAAFFGGSSVRLKGDVELTSPDGSTERTTHQTDMVIPFTLQGGINWEFAPDFEVGFDYRYYHYQVFQEQYTKLGKPLMGMTEMRDAKNYSNSGNWCFGLLYRPLPVLELMAGYQQDYTPIPDQTYSLDNPSRDQRGVGFGSRWQVTDRHRVGLSFVRNWFDLVDVQESTGNPPSNAKGHGANFEVGVDWMWRL